MTDPTTTPTPDQLRARLDRHTSALGHLTGGSWRAITRAHDTITATTDQVVELLGDYQLSSDLSVLENRAGWLQATLGEEARSGRPCYQTGRELIHVLAQIAGMARIALDAAAPQPEGGEPHEIDDLLIAGQKWANAPIPKGPADVLLPAADLLDALPHLRVDRVDVHRALRQAAAELLPDRDAAYATYVDAVELLTHHLAASGGDDWWVRDYGAPIGRDEAAGHLRDAATPKYGIPSTCQVAACTNRATA